MMRTSPTGLAAAAVAALALVACKGETVVKIDPKTQQSLDDCLAVQKDQKQLITSLQEENTRLQTKTSAEILVTIEGTALTVKPPRPGEHRPVSDKVTAAASKEFIDVVRRSRGAIQKCYEQALKKTTGLQSRTITLTVSASFSQSGAYQNARFAPSLGNTFDNCMRAVATNWRLSEKSPAMTFQTQVSLTPS